MTILDLDELDHVAGPATVHTPRDPGSPPRPRQPAPPRSAILRRNLLGADAVAFVAGWGLALAVAHEPTWGVAVAAIAGLLWLSTHGRYRAVECAEPTCGTGYVYEAAAVSAVALAVVQAPSRWTVVGGAVLAGAAGHALRKTWSARLRRHRREGRWLRRALVIGPAPEAGALANRLGSEPSLGLHVTRTCHELDVTTISRIVEDDRADTVVVATGSLDGATLTSLVRRLSRRGVAVQLVGGLARVDVRRLAPVSLGREASLLVQPISLDERQERVKRAFDIVVTIVLLLLLAPVLAATALAVKLGDGGPVLFRQERVGRGGRSFTMLKFRSMVVDAEARLAELEASNTRVGPLFKADDDPRVTRVGRVIRATSVDELPQLLNVLRGDMSLVGPRPALASEVTSFPDELLRRHDVPPGITGLWQVEGRDVPDFSAYEESDLYYVENWGVLLDLSILVRTVGAVAGRGTRALAGRCTS